MWYQSSNIQNRVEPHTWTLGARDLEVPITRSNSESFVIPPKKVSDMGWPIWTTWTMGGWGFVRLWNARLGRGWRMGCSIQLEIVSSERPMDVGYFSSVPHCDDQSCLGCQSYHAHLIGQNNDSVRSIVGKLNKINIMVRARYICTVLDQMRFGGRYFTSER